MGFAQFVKISPSVSFLVSGSLGFSCQRTKKAPRSGCFSLFLWNFFGKNQSEITNTDSILPIWAQLAVAVGANLPSAPLTTPAFCST